MIVRHHKWKEKTHTSLRFRCNLQKKLTLEMHHHGSNLDSRDSGIFNFEPPSSKINGNAVMIRNDFGHSHLNPRSSLTPRRLDVQNTY
jgi:hypothetical protein